MLQLESIRFGTAILATQLESIQFGPATLATQVQNIRFRVHTLTWKTFHLVELRWVEEFLHHLYNHTFANA